MKTLQVGEITITSLIERDGPWRTPEVMFPAYDPEIGRRHLAELDPIVFDSASGKMVITYQTFLVRTPKHIVLIDTCTGEDKGFPAPYDFPKQPWLDNLYAAGLSLDHITHVFCTHLHFDHTGWNTRLCNGRWTPTFPEGEIHLSQRRVRTLGGDLRARRVAAGARGGSAAGEFMELQLPADRGGGTGSACRRRVSARRQFHPHSNARPFAMPLLRDDPLAGPGGSGHRRPDASCAAMPGAGLVDHL